MEMEQLVNMVREAGARMTEKQISKIGEEARVKFGINQDVLMLLFLSGKQEFKDLIFKEAQK